MQFTIEHLADFDEVVALPEVIPGVDADTVQADARGSRAIRSGSARRRPTRSVTGKGVQVVDQAVQVPAEFTAAYAQFREGGWPGIASNPEFGGQGLPKTVSIACEEMWAAANVAFALCPELSQGAILALDRHGSDDTEAALPGKTRLRSSGPGTMCLTEPQAGSDLAALTTRAEPQGDGSYLITGRKIFITWGDHPMTENIAAPRAGAAAGCTAGHQGHLAVPRAQIQGG